ncbi:MAG: carboxyl transferase domain-containing protein [Pseudomonadota bacterium]
MGDGAKEPPGQPEVPESLAGTANSPDYASNRDAMLAAVADLCALEDRTAAASAQRNARFAERGQTPPRERLARLLDPGAPYLPLHRMAGYLADTDDPEKTLPGATFIGGIGYVSGIRAMVVVDDSGIRAGALAPYALQAMLSFLAIAQRQKLPFIHLVESAGANLMDYRVEDWAHGGGVFAGLAKLSAAGIPTVAVLHGPATAGGAYMPGLSDYVVGVRGMGMAALAGAALVEAATGERAQDADLGGAEMHAQTSGLVEYLAEDDRHALEITREVVARLAWGSHASDPDAGQSAATAIDYPEHLAGVVPANIFAPFDAREIAKRVLDAPGFTDFKPDFGPGTVCLQARLMGYAVGVLANNTPIDPAGAAKATQFLQACDQAGTPVIFLHNTTGYMVGTASEQAGMIKHGSKMIQAVANLRVPKIGFITGASFGAGNYGMGGWAFDPDFLFSWATARSGVMGGAQAAGTMSSVARAAAARKGAPVDEARLLAQEAAICAHFDRQAHPFYTSGRVLDHGVIDPRDTRAIAGFCLSICAEARVRSLNPSTYGVARI